MDAAQRAGIGFALLSAGQLAYGVQQFATGDTPLNLVATLVTIPAYAVAAVAVQSGRARMLTAALVVAFVGQAAPLPISLTNGFSSYTPPVILALVGLGMMAWASRPGGGHDFGVRAGALVAALATMLWFVAEPGLNGWVPGNALTAGGFLLVAISFRGVVERAPSAAET